MLDAIYPAVQSLQRDAEDGVALDDALAHAAAAAREGAQSTRDLEPRVGRAGWLAERSRGAEDAGAHLVALAFEAAAQAVAPAEPQSGGR
jgi:hypothetical protein